MKVKELKAILDKLPEDMMELQVRIFADHGQTLMPANAAEGGYMEADVYMGEEINSDDVDEGYGIPVFIISD